MERLEFRFVPDLDAIKNTSDALWRRSFWSASGLKRRAARNAGFLIGAPAFFIALGYASQWSGVPAWLVAPAFMLLAALCRIWVRLRFLRRPATIPAATPVTFSADANEGLRWAGVDGDFRLYWAGIDKVTATATDLAFLTGSHAWVVSRAGFADADECRDFVAMGIAKLSPQARAASQAEKSISQILNS